jgi:subtilisin-like proprotein convertase family protein
MVASTYSLARAARHALLALVALSACSSGEYLLDPLVQEQWYLSEEYSDNGVHINLGQSARRFTGQGILVAVVDDGLDRLYEDLRSNVAPGNVSYLPPSVSFDDAEHGTAVAGLIAAVEGNGLGGRGIAPGATVVGFNALRTPATSNLADALGRDLDRVHVSNNSWGDFNAWGEPFPLRSAIAAALELGVTEGRSGRGVVYVFSAGNGSEFSPGSGVQVDNVNYSGLVNNRWTVPVCAVDERGRRAYYSERGATLLVCAPSSSGRPGLRSVVTTDVTGLRGFNPGDLRNDLENPNYTRMFGGTSAAAPMVSAVVALMLEANPSLSWRDVRYILAATANRNDPGHRDWQANGAGLWVNHDYGFGIVNADRAVELAEHWTPLSASFSEAAEVLVDRPIPDNQSAGLSVELVLSNDLMVEFVDVYFDASDHPRIGDLEIELTSPAGTRSVLAEVHPQVFGLFRYRNWRFGTARHLGEAARGVWTIRARDLVPGSAGSLSSVKIVAHGTRQPASAQSIKPTTPSASSRHDSATKPDARPSLVFEPY